MFNFLREIKNKYLSVNKIGKYLAYTLGEITLVVIGILIAIKIDNWNERRKEFQLMRTYAGSLILDVKDDIAGIELRRDQIKNFISRIDSLSKYVRSKKPGELSNLILFTLATTDNYRPYSWNRSTIEDLKTSGVLRFEGNETVSKKIAEYDALSHHLDEDYITDLDVLLNISRLSGRIINSNYSNINELSKLRLLSTAFPITSPELLKAFDDAKEENVLVMTDDIKVIQEFMNGYIHLRMNLIIRCDKEMVNYINMGEELIDQLNLVLQKN